jgi:predicted dehydrogenase
MLKIAIAGCGLIATEKHIPAFLKLKDKVKVTALCDLNEDSAKRVSNKFNIKSYYTNFSDMLLREHPDIVDICTPPQIHAKLAMEAVERGSHVLLEKPMALKTGDCDEMIKRAAKYQKKICVIHNQLFNPAFFKAKELVSKGKIGKFSGMRIFLSTPADYITSKKDHWAHRLPGGILGETGPHAVYLALAFLKNVHDVEAYAGKFLHEYPWSSAEDFRINLLAENGIASIALLYGSNQWGAEVDIIGTQGILKIDLEARSVVRYNRPRLTAFSVGNSVFDMALGELGALASNGVRHILGKNYNAHAIGIRKFVESIIKGEQPPVNIDDARETVRLIEVMIDKLKNVQTKKIIS